MPDFLIVSDARWVREDVRAVVDGPGATVRELTRGSQVRAAVTERAPDLVILDLQIGKMGGMATSLDLRLEAGAGRLPDVKVLMLLDRRADAFLGRRAQADGWIVKPVDPMRLQGAIDAVLAGGTYEDDAYLPLTVPVPTPGR